MKHYAKESQKQKSFCCFKLKILLERSFMCVNIMRFSFGELLINREFCIEWKWEKNVCLHFYHSNN